MLNNLFNYFIIIFNISISKYFQSLSILFCKGIRIIWSRNYNVLLLNYFFLILKFVGKSFESNTMYIVNHSIPLVYFGKIHGTRRPEILLLLVILRKVESTVYKEDLTFLPLRINSPKQVLRYRFYDCGQLTDFLFILCDFISWTLPFLSIFLMKDS